MIIIANSLLDSYENHWDKNSKIYLLCAFIDQHWDHELATENGSATIGILFSDYLDQQSEDEINDY